MVRQTIANTVRLAVAVSVIAAAGCRGPVERVEVQEFPLRIALSGPLEEELPDSFLQLLLPFQPEECDKIALAPKVQVARLDLEELEWLDLEPDLDWIARVQERVRAGSIQQRRGSARRGFLRAKLPAQLTSPAAPMAASPEDVLLNGLGSTTTDLWILNERDNLSTTKVSTRAKITTDAKALFDTIGPDVCAFTRDGNNPPPITVVYGRPEPMRLANDQLDRDAAAPSLAEVRRNLEDGRLAEAERSLDEFRAIQPASAEAAQLTLDLEDKLRARIVLLKADGLSNDVVFSNQNKIAIPVDADEMGFRLMVEPAESVYVYLYGDFSDGRVRPLRGHGSSATSDALSGGESYFLPATDTTYRLTTQTGARMTRLLAVTTRWRARDLEELNRLLSSNDSAANEKVRRALLAREEAGLGGCAVRAVEFELTGESV